MFNSFLGILHGFGWLCVATGHSFYNSWRFRISFPSSTFPFSSLLYQKLLLCFSLFNVVDIGETRIWPSKTLDEEEKEIFLIGPKSCDIKRRWPYWWLDVERNKGPGFYFEKISLFCTQNIHRIRNHCLKEFYVAALHAIFFPYGDGIFFCLKTTLLPVSNGYFLNKYLIVAEKIRVVTHRHYNITKWCTI